MAQILAFKKEPYRSLEAFIKRAENMGAVGYGWKGESYHVSIEIAPGIWFNFEDCYGTSPDTTKQCRVFEKRCWLKAINTAETMILDLLHNEGVMA